MASDTASATNMKNAPCIAYLFFGGSFDPPHLGHLSIIRYVLEQGLCKHVLVVPAARSPFKQDRPPVEAKHRLALLEILLAELPEALRRQASIETWELERPPPSYTIDSLRHFSGLLEKAKVSILPEAGIKSGETSLSSGGGKDAMSFASELSFSDKERGLGLLLGSDSAFGLSKWNRAAEICQEFPLYIFRRSFEEESLRKELYAFAKSGHFSFAQEPVFLKNPLISCSSTDLRKSLRAGACLLPKQLSYIKKHSIYK